MEDQRYSTASSADPGDFEPLRVCVLIPAYNNAATLGQVLTGVLQWTNQVVVVNDGSTDNTSEVLQQFPGITIVSYPQNRGKGWALRKGFARALAMGFDHAISIDADGQHYPQDLPVFIHALRKNGDALIIGQRNMNQAGIPGKSNFGNRFSSFWFKVETGIRLSDTQSGYRLYPIRRLSGMRFFTRKYEFEIEVPVRAAWRGIPVTGVPISVYYPPPGERISHFRPFRDFTRISILNTVLCLIAFFYVWPKQLLKRIIPDKWLQSLEQMIYNPHESDQTKVFSVAFGLFMGIVPIWGFQLVTAIFLAFVFKLNKALVILAAHISIPPMIPLIIFLSFKVGAIWMPNSATHILFRKDATLEDIAINLRQYLLGGVTLAVLAALAGAVITFVLIKLTARKRTAAKGIQ